MKSILVLRAQLTSLILSLVILGMSNVISMQAPLPPSSLSPQSTKRAAHTVEIYAKLLGIHPSQLYTLAIQHTMPFADLPSGVEKNILDFVPLQLRPFFQALPLQLRQRLGGIAIETPPAAAGLLRSYIPYNVFLPLDIIIRSYRKALLRGGIKVSTRENDGTIIAIEWPGKAYGGWGINFIAQCPQPGRLILTGICTINFNTRRRTVHLLEQTNTSVAITEQKNILA